jgi:hypothetical protein
MEMNKYPHVLCPMCGYTPYEHDNYFCDMRFDFEQEKWHPSDKLLVSTWYMFDADMDAAHDALDEVCGRS